LNQDSKFLAVADFLILEHSRCFSINMNNLNKILYTHDQIGRRVVKSGIQQMPVESLTYSLLSYVEDIIILFWAFSSCIQL